MKIKDIIGRQIFDSRGNPTVEVDVLLEDGSLGRFSVPSGASTGEKEALELRDNEENFWGKGVSKAVDNINRVIKKALVGLDAYQQAFIDEILIKIDGTDNKSHLGANAILGVSGAVFIASSISQKIPVYKKFETISKIPRLMMNVINGGSHANNKIAFQEFMIIPIGKDIHDSIQIGGSVFHALKKLLVRRGESISVGDEGGFTPSLDNNFQVLDLLQEAVVAAGYQTGVDVFFALDVAASQLYEHGVYKFDNQSFSSEGLVDYYLDLIARYPIISIEDPFEENDWSGFQLLLSKVEDKVLIVGDDLFVTNSDYLRIGIEQKAANAILIKPNQVGTITETLNTIRLAKENGYQTIMSHRSGETENTFIADLCIGLSMDYIKCGSFSRTDRIGKYNQLLRIEESLWEESQL